MTRTRILTIALSAALLIGPTMTTAQASTWRDAECRYQYVDGHRNWTVTEVKATIVCAAAKFHVSVLTAFYVADRESRFRQYARNAYSGAAGIYQHLPVYWPARYAAFAGGHRKLLPAGSSAYNARSNVLVALWMAQTSWAPWGM